MASASNKQVPRNLDQFWEYSAAEVCASLETSASGLTSSDASKRLRLYGHNDARPRRTTGLVGEIGRLILSPLVIILLLASGISFAVGDHVGATIIGTMVVLSLSLDFYQTHRSATAARRLAQLVATTASVSRDGAVQEIPFALLVPGDIIHLGVGDLVPADCRLLSGRSLSVNEAALTGESLPVEKSAEAVVHGNVSNALNAVFLGSSVLGGAADAIVVHTGASTELGHISRSLAAKAPETEFERGMGAFATLIARTVAFLVLFVFLVNTLFGRNPLESFLFAVALAVGLTPEFMPMIVSVTLAEGAVRMSRHRVIVKHLSAIQNLGAVDVLCSDKTGTLTEGEVKVADLDSPWGASEQRIAELACLNSAFATALASPLDRAILQLPEHTRISGAVKLGELPFDFVRRRVSVLVRTGDGCALLLTKGSPESVIEVCTRRLTESGTQPLDGASRQEAQAAFVRESEQGHRSLAVAFREIADPQAPDALSEEDLTYAGLVSFEDPPQPGVAETVLALARKDVALKILTGDDPVIAQRVCDSVGLVVSRVVTGQEVDRLSDPALGAVAEKAEVFARLTPEQKHRVLLALKHRGHVVGYLGDGINDAPSLHAADVGISVAGAVDVARDAADIILLEKSLSALLDGITEGRRSFGNIMKYIMMATSSNFGNMFSMAGATLFLPFLPLLPVQILLNNLLYDLSQLTIPSDAVDEELTLTPKKWNMHLVRDFMLVFGPISSVFDFVTFGALWFFFRAQPELFRTGWFVESLATQTLVIFVIRTMRAPWKSRPRWSLVASVTAILCIGIGVPFSPLAADLGFAVPPLAFYPFLLVVVLVYLALVEMAKRFFYRRHSL